MPLSLSCYMGSLRGNVDRTKPVEVVVDSCFVPIFIWILVALPLGSVLFVLFT